MEDKNKFYLSNINYDGFKKNHKIIYEMPPFCSGDYEAIIYEDEKGLFIDSKNNFFKGCRYFEVAQNEMIDGVNTISNND